MNPTPAPPAGPCCSVDEEGREGHWMVDLHVAQALARDLAAARAALEQIEQRHPAQADVDEHQDGFSYHFRFCEECDGGWLPDKDEEHEPECATGIARAALARLEAGDCRLTPGQPLNAE